METERNTELAIRERSALNVLVFYTSYSFNMLTSREHNMYADGCEVCESRQWCVLLS